MRYLCSLRQKFVEFKYRNSNNYGRIFMFHQVNDDKNQWNNKSICITKENFQYFINKLIESGYSFKSISELNKDSSPNNVFITFDDIFLDAYLNAITYLNEKKIPYCVFITTDYVDKEPYISKSILKELSENPLCTIGAHTKSHPILRFLNESEARKEISKDHLEDLIKKKIDYFAYPYGSNYAVSKSNIKIVQEASYKMAFSTYSMGIDKIYFEKNKFFIPRININNKTYLGWCD